MKPSQEVRSIRRFFSGLLNRFAERTYEISFDEHGFVVTPAPATGETPSQITWDSVAEITGYKIDVITTDLICFDIKSSGGTHVVLDEDMTGWARLIEALPQRLPGCLTGQEWFSRVAFPPFASSNTTIYKRQP